MSNQIRIELTPQAEALLRTVERMPQSMLVSIAQAMDRENQLTIAHITERRLTGRGPYPPEMGKLGVRTGHLRRSLRSSKAIVSGQSVSSAIGTNVRYAGAHEFGAKIPPFEIKPRGKALKFKIGDRVVFASKVKHPGMTIPARAPIQRGIADRANDYGAAISKAIVSAWEGK